MRLGLPVFILTLAMGGFALLWMTRSPTLPVPVEEKAWRVSVVEIVPGRYAPDLLLYGTVEAPRRASLRTAVNADVAEVPTAEGRQVSAGEPLVILDDREIELVLRQRLADLAEIEALIDSEQQRHQSDLIALKRERALLDLAKKEVTRAEDLYQRKLGSQSLLDEARQALERQALSLNTRQLAVDEHPARLAQLEARRARALALTNQAQLDLQRTRITAPFSGRIIRVPVAPGDRVRVGDLLVEAYPLAALEIRAQIPFPHLSAVRAALTEGNDLTATGQVDDCPLRAVLDRLAGEVSEASGGMEALFRIQKGAECLVPGRLLSLLVSLPAQDDLVELPFEALYGLNRVYRLENGRMAAVAVKRIGEHRAADGTMRVLVKSPRLQAGDQIITTQLPNAVTGLKVIVADS